MIGGFARKVRSIGRAKSNETSGPGVIRLVGTNEDVAVATMKDKQLAAVSYLPALDTLGRRNVFADGHTFVVDFVLRVGFDGKVRTRGNC